MQSDYEVIVPVTAKKFDGNMMQIFVRVMTANLNEWIVFDSKTHEGILLEETFPKSVIQQIQEQIEKNIHMVYLAMRTAELNRKYGDS